MLQQEALLSAPVPRAAPREPGAGLRAIARVRWFSLDGRLAAGEDPARSRLLAAQAARLTSPRQRERLADALGGLLRAAARGPAVSRLSPSRIALSRNEAALRELARRVGSQETLYAGGLARLERLISDSTGPVFRGDAGELSAELGRIESELSGAFTREPEARRPKRRPARLGHGPAIDPPGFAGGSFVLPDGSWFHGRRES
jgi:hypothetical protein